MNMETTLADNLYGRDEGDVSASESRRWMRDLGALLALPAMWVDQDPIEIVTGLLSVLFGMLQLDGVYVRFDEHQPALLVEGWRPIGPNVPAELRDLSATNSTLVSGVKTIAVHSSDLGAVRVASLQIALPWEAGIVLVSSVRTDFPTVTETHLLRVAAGQAAIAIHTARSLLNERQSRTAAEVKLARQAEILRTLIEDVEPSLTLVADRIRDAAAAVAEDAPPGDLESAAATTQSPVPVPVLGVIHVSSPGLPLTRRETEVLGLLAQGLTNKEIAALMWLSDRTVERHVTSLYRKIGVRRRSEATAFALRHALI
ncbi:MULTISPECIES: helix-turn-helix transcriptional regulator [unclassified Leifsonia]|uniref:helix-turn-helix transcriptional regulator n=1 Tax=unclassified Leifsonia TaxID=2663824 RepID=UPI0007001EFD|nr:MULTISPECIES: helix-turn-helix transcriptional regulator [unclassified Leifsonia]KQX07751.1 hypothetical protein ASC59_08470 [Leifsonia sp. Root1293]KRA12033.1 hypothetical protein ASD61_08470 [Leifsonia sp. Root60]